MMRIITNINFFFFSSVFDTIINTNEYLKAIINYKYYIKVLSHNIIIIIILKR